MYWRRGAGLKDEIGDFVQAGMFFVFRPSGKQKIPCLPRLIRKQAELPSEQPAP
jgi:hypothetical protein